jgi:hypothetical protein
MTKQDVLNTISNRLDKQLRELFSYITEFNFDWTDMQYTDVTAHFSIEQYNHTSRANAVVKGEVIEQVKQLTAERLLDCPCSIVSFLITEEIDQMTETVCYSVDFAIRVKTGTSSDEDRSRTAMTQDEVLRRVQGWLEGMLGYIHRCQGEVLEVPADSAYYFLDMIKEVRDGHLHD